MPLIESTPERLAHDRTMATQPTVAALFTETAKAVSVLNGGGAIAMLGLMQVLLQHGGRSFELYKPCGVTALAFFASGALLVGLTFFARWLLAFWSDVEGSERLRRWLFAATFTLLAASLVAFAVGCFFAGFGMAKL